MQLPTINPRVGIGSAWELEVMQTTLNVVAVVAIILMLYVLMRFLGWI